MFKILNNIIVQTNKTHKIFLSDDLNITDNITYCYNIRIDKNENILFYDKLLKYSKGLIGFN